MRRLVFSMGAMIFVMGTFLAGGAIVIRQSAEAIRVKNKKMKTIKIIVVKKELSPKVKLPQDDLILREWSE